MTRVYLSPPHMTGVESMLVKEVFESNWIAPLGPQVNAFEREMCKKIGVEYACALSSGTAGLHLALIILNVKRGDEVWCSSLTFSASANAISYVGAVPVFLDSDRRTWNMDPSLLAEELDNAQKKGKLPKAIIVVDLYGQCAEYGPILDICDRYKVPVIEDAAEALGASYSGRCAGTFGEMAILSFNGNKIITTGGGGMLLSNYESYTKRALHLATQARDPAPHYEHSEIGYNYRMSNVLAAIGRGQLQGLDDKVNARRRNFNFYYEALKDLPGIEFMPEANYGKCTRWLSCLTVDEKELGVSRDHILAYLEKHNIEARPVWKPMHLQPVFSGHRVIGGSVSEHLFRSGLCLPSGSSLTDNELTRVVDAFRSAILGL